MLKLVLLALFLFASDAESAKRNEQSITTARAAVAEMIRIAKTPEEKALAEKDRAIVERAAALVSQQAAAKQTEETQMSFNLQYLQLQSQMQHENRSYTAISNIMKTKHDTVKNSISNIR
jgi:hypothetical protein